MGGVLGASRSAIDDAFGIGQSGMGGGGWGNARNAIAARAWPGHLGM